MYRPVKLTRMYFHKWIKAGQCPWCGKEKDHFFVLPLSPRQYIGHCFHCSQSHRLSRRDYEILSCVSRLDDHMYYDYSSVHHHGCRIPSGFTHVINQIGQQYLIKRHKLYKHELKRYHILFKDQDKILFPIFNSDHELIYYQIYHRINNNNNNKINNNYNTKINNHSNKIHDQSHNYSNNYDHKRLYNPQHISSSHIVFNSQHVGSPVGENPLSPAPPPHVGCHMPVNDGLVVESIVSAIKCGRVIPTLAMLGKKIKIGPILTHISHRVILFLDPDVTEQMIMKEIVELSKWRDVVVVRHTKKPKELSTPEMRRIIDACRARKSGIFTIG